MSDGIMGFFISFFVTFYDFQILSNTHIFPLI